MTTRLIRRFREVVCHAGKEIAYLLQLILLVLIARDHLILRPDHILRGCTFAQTEKLQGTGVVHGGALGAIRGPHDEHRAPSIFSAVDLGQQVGRRAL